MMQPINRRDMFRLGAAATAMAAMDVTPLSAQVAAPRQRVTPRGGSQLDHRDMQLLFADLQVPLVATSATTPPAALSRSAAVLARVATILDMPMLFSVVLEGKAPPHLIPELRPFATTTNTILRMPVSPFQDPPTVAALAKSGRKTLVIAGFAAEAVVLQAALDGIAAGYTVFYVIDAVGSQSARTEGAALRDIERAGAIPTSVLSLSTRLVHDFISAPGIDVIAALKPVL